MCQYGHKKRTSDPNSGKFSLLQMDGLVEVKMLNEVLDKAKVACQKIYEVQKNALKDKYKKVV